MARILIFFLCIPVLFISACKDKRQHSLDSIIKLDYPSASGIEYHNKLLFVMGDDARSLMILDTQFNIKDSIKLFPGDGRIGKDVKPDFESISLVRTSHRNQLLLLGSGSLDPYRKMALIIDPFRKTTDSVRLDSFYNRLKELGVTDLNIEGATQVHGGIALACRGNKSFPRNFLVFTSHEFWLKQSSVPVSITRTGYSADSSLFSGISGLTYASKSDQLIITVSTEDTRNSYDDGAIGKSYLWIIKNISAKREWSAINPDIIIDLEETDQRFKGYKIESACIINDKKKELELILAADNDDGSSTLFKLTVIKE